VERVVPDAPSPRDCSAACVVFPDKTLYSQS